MRNSFIVIAFLLIACGNNASKHNVSKDKYKITFKKNNDQYILFKSLFISTSWDNPLEFIDTNLSKETIMMNKNSYWFKKNLITEKSFSIVGVDSNNQVNIYRINSLSDTVIIVNRTFKYKIDLVGNNTFDSIIVRRQVFENFKNESNVSILKFNKQGPFTESFFINENDKIIYDLKYYKNQELINKNLTVANLKKDTTLKIW